jgi:hypothetical protein
MEKVEIWSVSEFIDLFFMWINLNKVLARLIKAKNLSILDFGWF